LVDSDDQGLLLQLFTQPISEGGQFFVEFVQREGSEGFGANNVRALYAAVDAALKQRATS
jgi:4-hydroxyphenylpyruvate dioxygenase